MIVCPSCRTLNDESAQLCSRCGRSLEPGASPMVSVRRTGAELPALDIKTPKLPSRWRPIVVLGVLIGLIAGFVSWRLFRPDPCRGRNFTSNMFGYCLTVPAGWIPGRAQVGNVSLDQFSVPAQSTAVLVEAVDLAAGAQLSQFGDFVRGRDVQAGITPGSVQPTALGGVPAEEWDMTVTAQSGNTFRLREVVAVRNEVGWRITLNDSVDGFDAHARVFQQMLASWGFD